MKKIERGLYVNPENVSHVVEATAEMRMSMSNPSTGFQVPPTVKTFIYTCGSNVIMTGLVHTKVLALLAGMLRYNEEGKIVKS